MNPDEHLHPHRLTVFLFHGVVPEHEHDVRNYTRKHIDAGRFEEVLERLAEKGNPVHLDDAVASDNESIRPENAFAITFDDGFRNNATVAARILRHQGLPATFYVTTGFIEANEGSWIDRIERSVAAAEAPAVILPGDTKPLPIDSSERQRRVLERIRKEVKEAANIDPYVYAEAIAKQLGDGPRDPNLDDMMGWDEAASLHQDSLFEVGGHSHTHRILSFLSHDDLNVEIEQSLSLLKQKAAIESRHYSYPEGLAHCYDDRVIDALKQNGIVASPTAIEGTNAWGADPFHLKRVMVQ